MINIWFMAAKVVLVLTESSPLHCSISPVDPSQRNTVRTWIFVIYFFARTACVRHILHKVSLKSISFLSIRSFNKIIVFEHSSCSISLPEHRLLQTPHISAERPLFFLWFPALRILKSTGPVPLLGKNTDVMVLKIYLNHGWKQQITFTLITETSHFLCT